MPLDEVDGLSTSFMALQVLSASVLIATHVFEKSNRRKNLLP